MSNKIDINSYLEHSALKPDATKNDIIIACEETLKYNLYGVVVNPVWVKTAASELKKSRTIVVSVCSFPFGASRTDVKTIEAVNAVNDGASEVDVVANIGWIKSENFSEVENEMRIIKEHLSAEIILKVIIECGKLTDFQQQEAAKAIINSGANYIKTSTGLFGGATESSVSSLKKTANGQIKIKASGGIKTYQQAEKLIRSGADKIGSSSSVAIMEEFYQLTV